METSWIFMTRAWRLSDRTRLREYRRLFCIPIGSCHVRGMTSTYDWLTGTRGEDNRSLANDSCIRTETGFFLFSNIPIYTHTHDRKWLRYCVFPISRTKITAFRQVTASHMCIRLSLPTGVVVFLFSPPVSLIKLYSLSGVVKIWKIIWENSCWTIQNWACCVRPPLLLLFLHDNLPVRGKK